MKIQKARSAVYSSIRDFFTSRAFCEVETPCLAPAVIPESTIQLFETRQHLANDSWPLYLLPSPEYYMKQLLSRGSGDIFQISRSFRNAEVPSGQHGREFSMLEWYKLNYDYRQNMQLQEELIGHLLEDTKVLDSLEPLHPDHAGFEHMRASLQRPFERISLQEAFSRWAQIDLRSAVQAGAFPKSSSSLLGPRQESFADAFHRLLCSQIEPNIPKDQPVFLYDYPAAVPTTAKTNGLWAERWELYLRGMEITNCYSEAGAQQTEIYCQQENRLLNNQGRSEISCTLFPDLIQHLPPCSGGALGIDRLLMVLTGEKQLEGVIFFPEHASVRE